MGEVLIQIYAGSAEDADKAVQVLKHSFPKTWIEKYKPFSGGWFVRLWCELKEVKA
ncbi:MAG: hypothetical protein H5T34_00805 [Candidatus Methanomethyliales bacterium]|nr:hypothetical protein [Candidatus Methanomethylicales archaeon]